MIVVQQRPYDYCMSGNPIAYELYSALAASNTDIYFEVKIKFAYTNNLFYITLVTFPVYPVTGIAKFDIKDFLDGKLEHNIPAFNVNEKLATGAPDQAGIFYIEYREILTTGSEPSWDESEIDYKKVVIKGGLNYFKYRGDNFWRNYFEDNNPFLTWQKSGRLARKQDRMYLAFLNTLALPSWDIPEVVGPTLWSSAKAYYTDGTESARQYIDVTDNYVNGINFIPAGCDQWGLQDLDSEKTIWKWDIQMFYTSASDGSKTALNDPYLFEADNRNDYNNYLLQFRNSLGGIDPILLRGVLEPNQNYTFDEQQRTFLNDYFSGDYISPARVMANSREKTVWKADAGFLPKEDQDRLRDMNLNRNAWWEISTKWWPVTILSPSFKQKTSEDTIWPFPVEFSLAADADKYYTPDAVDLGDEVFASNVCAAEISAITTDVDTSGPTATMEFSFTYPPGLLLFRYQIVGVHADPIEAATGTLPITITDLALDSNFVLKIWPVCSNGVRGRAFTATFNTVGDGGSGGGGTGESSITNNTGFDQNIIVRVDGVDKYTGFIGSGGIDSFTVADTPGAEVRVIFENTPTGGTATSDSVLYDTPIVNTNLLRFNDVNIVGGIEIVAF